MSCENFLQVALDLEQNGLIWEPEIGDEVIERDADGKVSILVDPQGLTPPELRRAYVWLPTVEQLVEEVESRLGALIHAGVSTSCAYEALIKTEFGIIEGEGLTLREAIGGALKDLIANKASAVVH